MAHLTKAWPIFSATIFWLLPVATTASAEVPSTLFGRWTNETPAPTANPQMVAFAHGAAAIDGKPCQLDGLRPIHSTRWYVDFTCGIAASPYRVELDLNLLSENRVMINRRPLAEADTYVRRAHGTAE